MTYQKNNHNISNNNSKYDPTKKRPTEIQIPFFYLFQNFKSMSETTFMINTESIIKHNKMIPDRSQPN